MGGGATAGVQGWGGLVQEWTEADVRSVDTLVIGAGFGGLAAALTLAEAGVPVLLAEALRYPGGCASSFTKGGHRFETGATLFSGFGDSGLMTRWIQRHKLPVQVERLDPLITLRAPGLELPITADRGPVVEHLAGLAGDKAEGVRRFFAAQERIAGLLWELFDDPELLPPIGPSALLRHLGRSPRYLPLLRWIGEPLVALLRHHGVADVAPLRLYLDALCQITVQASSEQAEAPFALGAMDYCFRGTAHIHGGIGELAQALADAVVAQGGELRLSARVKAIEPVAGGFEVQLRGERVRCRRVVANLLPGALQSLLPAELPSLTSLAEQVQRGWSAVMLYLVVDDHPGLPRVPFHLQLIQDPGAPLREGNHLFVSVGGVGEQPGTHRTVTVSTHVGLEGFRALGERQGARVAEIQARMRAGLEAMAPQVVERVVQVYPASPRTWERFTRRPGGAVGGIPRVAGLQNYRGMWPSPVMPGLHLVGDSVFPGQSTLATALGGLKLAQRLIA